MVQWLSIRLPMQGMKVRSLVRELRSHVCCNEDPAQPTLSPKKELGPRPTGLLIWCQKYQPQLSLTLRGLRFLPMELLL